MLRRSLVLFVSTAATACQPSLTGALRAYEAANYPVAQASLAEVARGELEPRERARCLLYLGLSELALGHAQRAAAHLGLARAALEADPAALEVRDRERLFVAWASLGLAPGD